MDYFFIRVGSFSKFICILYMYHLGMYLLPSIHGLRTPNEDINQRYLKNWAEVADKICFGRTYFGSGSEFSAVQWRLFPLWASVVRGNTAWLRTEPSELVNFIEKLGQQSLVRKIVWFSIFMFQGMFTMIHLQKLQLWYLSMVGVW